MRNPWTGDYSEHSVKSLTEVAFIRGVLAGALGVVFVILLVAAVTLADRAFF